MATHYPALKFEVMYGVAEWDNTGAWTDETQYLRKATSDRGRQHELQAFDASASTVTLNDPARRFDPSNTSSPLNGLLVPGVRHRLQAWDGAAWRAIFHTWSEKWKPERYVQNMNRCVLSGKDSFKALRRKSFTSTSWPTTLAGIYGPGPRAYYRLGDTQGSGVVKDSSANAFHGAVAAGDAAPELGAPGALVADIDTAVHFPARSDSAATPSGLGLPGAVGAMGPGSLTIGFWAKAPAGSIGPRLDWRHPSGYTPYSQWIMQPLGGEGVFYSDGTNAFELGGDAFGGAALADGKWHLFVWTRDGDGVTNHAYVDGVLKTTGVAAFGIDLNAAGAQTLRVGPGFGVPGQSNECWMDELFFINSTFSLANIAALYNDGAGKWRGQSPGQRFNVVLDTLGWPAGDRAISAGFAGLAAPENLGGTKTLDHLQAVEASEGGMFFQNASGLQVLRDRYYPLTAPGNSPILAFGDGALEIPYESDPDRWIDDLDTWDEAIVTRDGGAPQRAGNVSGLATLTKSGLLFDNDNQSLDLANWLVLLYKTAHVRVGQVRIHAGALPSGMWHGLLTAEIGQRVLVNGRPIPTTSPMFSYPQIIEGITHEFDMDTHEWWMTFELAPAVDVAMWMLGTSALGVDTYLAY